MKKNKMMRLASALLVAVMLTTCTISGTYAKYVTTGETTDKARVAKWGIEIQTAGNTFAETYTLDDTTSTLTGNSVASSGAIDVAGVEYTKLVAPGTSGDFLESSITGTPEVAFRVEYKLTAVKLTGWEIVYNDSDEVYFPIVITVWRNGDRVGVVDGKTITAADDADLTNKIKDAVNNILVGCGKDYAPNTTVNNDYVNITWEWPFSDVANDVISENDEKDTLLGNAAADDAPGIIDVTLTTTVTQID